METAKLFLRPFVMMPAFLTLTAISAGAWGASDAVTVNPDNMKWGDAPPSLPKGAKITVLYGDPSKAGPFCVRLKMPAGYKIPAHWHSQAEALTVISGGFYLGMGDKLDVAAAHLLKAGGFHYLPPQEHHFAFANGASVVQINGEGPFDITYIDAADDPQKKSKG